MWDWADLSWEVGRLLIAAGLGAAIGLERETHGRYAGLRTNLLVCLGSCLMMMVSLNMEAIFGHLGVDSAVRLDPGRIASYALAGMGFIGAGTIIKGKGTVRGLTTAATLWLVTGLGLGVGAGYVIPAVATTLIALGALFGFRRLPFNRDLTTELTLKLCGPERHTDQIKAILEDQAGVKTVFISFHEDLANETVTYHIQLETKQSLPYSKFLDQFRELACLEEVSWEVGEVP